MVPDIVRDSIAGLVVNQLSNGRFFPFRDQKLNYVIPAKYVNNAPLDTGYNSRRTNSDDATTLCETPPRKPNANGDLESSHKVNFGLTEQAGKAKNSKPAERNASPQREEEHERKRFLVEFEENDADRPLNWSFGKRVFVGGLISFLTFSVYVGSAIYTSSIPDLMIEFGVSQTLATAGLSLFIFAYGLGPMILSPLQEMAVMGRTPIYIAGLFLFVLFQVPVIFAPNFATILVFRALAGFVGSPALATGGSSISEIFDPSYSAIGIGSWALGAVCGPVFGPVTAGFSAQANGWRWPIYELLWITGFALIVLTFFLPETYEPTILKRRAARLRKLTGNPQLKAQCELEEHENFFTLAGQNVSRAFRLCAEPAVLFANSYIALLYSIFYLWFESFPLVYQEIHGFNLGLAGLPYLSFVVAAVITFPLYCWYQLRVIRPKLKQPNFQPEKRLELGLYAGFFIPASLILFGWSGARENVHWIVPTIGAGLYFPGIFILFQVLSLYIFMGYPKYSASILAGNAFFRSAIASVFPLFGHQFFSSKLGLGGGCTLLAGISLAMIPVLHLLCRKGDKLRAKSKFAG